MHRFKTNPQFLDKGIISIGSLDKRVVKYKVTPTKYNPIIGVIHKQRTEGVTRLTYAQEVYPHMMLLLTIKWFLY